MKFEFISNACGIFYGSKKTKILCDPWVVNKVFEGSWFNYPPLKTKIKDLQKVDAIYLSHIHPDHYDERNFDFPKEVPIIILDEGPNFLKKNLIKKGYNNFIEIKNNETKSFKEFELTLYKPFTKHIYEESLLGNLIDSALVVKEDDIVAINFNDNTPDAKACVELNKKFGTINLALMNYNAAGPYPSCFDNLSENNKKNEHDRILKRNFDHLCETIPLLKPKAVMPFAGAYVIGGKNYKKNDYLGTTTWDVCADYLEKNLNFETKIFCLNENQIFDISSLKREGNYQKVNIEEMKNYIEKIKTEKYDYELDEFPCLEKLEEDVKLARVKLKERTNKYKINLKSNVYLEFNGKKIKILDGIEKNQNLFCSLDNRLLRRILDKKSHWNNAEIGTHISFKREPNKMDPDVHTMMSFFHI